MAMLATPKSLGDVWELPVGAFMPGMRQFEQAQQFDAQTLGDMMSAEQYKQQERPLTLAGIAGQNRNRDAELPGIQARGKIATLEADQKLANYDQDIEAYAVANREKINKAHYESAMRAGPLLRQYSERAAYDSSVIPRIRELMTSQGMGDFWNPEWDRSDPKTVVAGMFDLSEALTNATPAMQKMMAGLDSKEAIASEKNATAERMAELRAKTSRDVAAARKAAGGGTKGGGDVKKLEQLAAGLRARAMTETDPETKAMLVDNYNDVMSDMWKLKTATSAPPKQQIDPSIAPGVFATPEPKADPFARKGSTPKTGDKLPDGSIFIGKD